MSLTTEERDRIRADAEVALLATLRSLADDCEAIITHTSENNVTLSLISRAIDDATEAHYAIRRIRDEYEMTIRADARIGLTRLEE